MDIQVISSGPLNHCLIKTEISQYHYICNKCDIIYYHNINDQFTAVEFKNGFPVKTLQHLKSLTCEEIIIKKLLE